jgi:hypothetical protein
VNSTVKLGIRIYPDRKDQFGFDLFGDRFIGCATARAKPLGATPDLFTFPTTWVCFDCGFSTFTLAQNELLELKEASVKAGAIERN